MLEKNLLVYATSGSLAGARLKHGHGRIEVGTIPALEIEVGVRMFAVDGT
jgi:hypothetical protein